MPSAEIGNIVIKGNKAGMAYGGYIYSANINIGNSSTPTKLSISVVHKQGINSKTKENLKKDIDDLIQTSIKIGDLDNIYMHLIGYQIRRNLGSHLLTLEYTDGSILLDKIQVCLAERQYAIDQQNKIYPSAAGSVKENSEAEFTVVPICNGCDGTGEMIDKSKYSAYGVKQNAVTCAAANGEWDAATETCNFKVERSIKYASDSSFSFSSTKEFPFFYVPSYPSKLKSEGGLLVVGRENFVENNCDIPDVDYTFSDLLGAFGVGESGNNQYITVKGDSLKDRTKDSSGYSSYRRDYSGTLREVLSSWCSDFGYSFTWNIFNSEPQIIGIDLTKNVGGSKINEVKTLVDSIKLTDAKDNDSIVESTTESYSKEGSFKQSYISQYLKPAKTKSKKSKKYVKKLFYNVPLELITSDGVSISSVASSFGRAYVTREWGGRTLKDQITAASIGKYNKEARISYLWGRAVRGAAGAGGCANTLGYTNPTTLNRSGLVEISQKAANAIIAEWDEQQLVKVLSQFGGPEFNVTNKAGRTTWYGFNLFFAYYNDSDRAYWEQWDEQVADFIGRYYFKPITDGELDEKGVITKAAFENVTKMIAGRGEVQAFPFRKGHENQDAANFPWAKFVKAGESHRLHMVFPYLRAREVIANGKKMSQQGIPKDFIDPDTGDIDTKFSEDSDHYRSDNATYENGIWAFERDSQWGTTREEADIFFRTTSGSSMFQNYLPMHLPLEGRALMIYQNLVKKGRVPALEKLKDSNITPVLVVGPSYKRSASLGMTQKDGADGFIGVKNINDAIFTRRYFGETAENYREQVSHRISDLGSGSERRKENNSRSITMCEASTVEELCGICGFEDSENTPYTGFPYWGYMRKITDVNEDGSTSGTLVPAGTICEAFGLRAIGIERSSTGASFFRIILPCQLDYVGYLEIDYNSRQTIEGVSKIFGSPLPLGKNENGLTEKADDYVNKTLGIKLLENNITNDADSSLFDDDQERILNMFMPNGFDVTTGAPKHKSITAQEYHNEIKKYFDSNNLGVDLARQQFAFSVAGLNFSKIKGDGETSLSELLKPDKGWSTMAIVYGENGITANFAFETRPAVLPNPQVFMKHLGPKLNTYR